MVAGVELRLVKAEIFQLYRISKYSNYQLIECLFYAIIESMENTSKLRKHRIHSNNMEESTMWSLDLYHVRKEGREMETFSIFRVDVDVGVSPLV